MKKRILTPIVMGVLASAVITGCSSSNKSEPAEKKVCDYNISGGNAVDIMFGTQYADPDVSVTYEGKDITFKQEGAVDSSQLGTYEVTYTGESCKNTQVRTVKVVSSSCAYKLTGDNPLQISLGDTFIEPGFEIKDINNKTVTGAVTGVVDTSTAGDYTLTYKGEGCKNSQTRTVQVVSGSCDYTLIGDNPLMLNLGDNYSDLGVTVKDSKQNTVTSTASGTVDTSIEGDYTITYQGVGCSNKQTRKVTVKPAASACTYDLNGANPLEVTVGGAYQELGVSIKDANDQTVTGTTSGSVDTSKLGDNTITYQSDSCTNTTTRTVTVVSADCSYTLLGNDPLILSKGDTFPDPSVVVKDRGDVVVTSTMSGDLDTTTVGDYTITYQGKDCANSQTRKVIVKLQTCEYTLLGGSSLEIVVNGSYTDPGATIKDKSGEVLEAKAMGTSTVAVNSAQVGEYVVSYKHDDCGNSKERIVSIRGLNEEELKEELKETILPKI